MYSTAILDPNARRVMARVTLPTVSAVTTDAGDTASNVPEPTWAAAWSGDGSRLFLGTGNVRTPTGTSGAVVAVDARTWRPVQRIPEKGSVSSLHVSPDGRVIAAGLSTGMIDIIDAHTYAHLHSLTASGPVTAVAFSPDGAHLAAVGTSTRLDSWTTRTWKPVLTAPPSFLGSGISVEWLPDNTTVVYGGNDGRAVLFDITRDIPRAVPLPQFRDGADGDVHIVPPTGSQLVLLPGWRSVDQLREGKVYSLDASDWLADACSIVERDLTPTEWAAYLPEQPYRPTCTDLG
jgi:WD40 repeat protein